MVLWWGKSPLCSPAATPWKDKAQELAPGLSLSRLGPFPTSLQPTKALELAIELLGSLHTSLQRCSLLGNESHLTPRLRIPPEVTVCVLTQEEGDCMCLPTLNVLNRGCVGVVCSRCAHPKRPWGAWPLQPTAYQLFTPPAFSHLPVCLRLSMCSHTNSTDSEWVPRWQTRPDSQFELIADGLHAPWTTGRARGRQPPCRERSLLHKSHSYPITKKNDSPGTPPGISGELLMQDLGRIFVPGFALNWFLKHIHIQAWASSPKGLCKSSFVCKVLTSMSQSSSAPYGGLCTTPRRKKWYKICWQIICERPELQPRQIKIKEIKIVVCVFYEGNIYIFKLGVIVFCIWNGIWKWFSGTMWFLIGAWTSSRTFFIISIIKIPIIWSFFLTWSERMFPKKRLLGCFLFPFVALILQAFTYMLHLVSSPREVNQGSPQQQS